MSTVRWPHGCRDYYQWCEKYNDEILHGLLIAFDPSSGSTSPPGFAIFYAGELQTKGTIDIPKTRNVYHRLQVLAEKVSTITPSAPDVVVVEQIMKGMGHVSLIHAVGAIVASARTIKVEQCPIPVWKAVAATSPTYVKGDAADAEMIGLASILRARLA